MKHLIRATYREFKRLSAIKKERLPNQNMFNTICEHLIAEKLIKIEILTATTLAKNQKLNKKNNLNKIKLTKLIVDLFR